LIRRFRTKARIADRTAEVGLIAQHPVGSGSRQAGSAAADPDPGQHRPQPDAVVALPGAGDPGDRPTPSISSQVNLARQPAPRPTDGFPARPLVDFPPGGSGSLPSRGPRPRCGYCPSVGVRAGSVPRLRYHRRVHGPTGSPTRWWASAPGELRRARRASRPDAARDRPIGTMPADRVIHSVLLCFGTSAMRQDCRRCTSPRERRGDSHGYAGCARTNQSRRRRTTRAYFHPPPVAAQRPDAGG
jgi:hypothetical protein